MQVRVGDRERRAVDDQLMAAVADGMLTSVLDLRQPDLPSGARVRARALMGEVEVLVPEGAAVHLKGMSVMGERKMQTARTGAGPVVHVHGLAVMGSITVRHGEVRRPRQQGTRWLREAGRHSWPG